MTVNRKVRNKLRETVEDFRISSLIPWCRNRVVRLYYFCSGLLRIKTSFCNLWVYMPVQLYEVPI